MKSIVVSITLVCCASAFALDASQLVETRYCGVPQRTASGGIVRSQAVVNAFKKHHPCPATGKASGACPGWQINHVIPLACGGCDSVSNMDWMPTKIKTCKEDWCRDRYERKIYGKDIEGTQNCKNETVRVE